MVEALLNGAAYLVAAPPIYKVLPCGGNARVKQGEVRFSLDN